MTVVVVVEVSQRTVGSLSECPDQFESRQVHRVLYSASRMVSYLEIFDPMSDERIMDHRHRRIHRCLACKITRLDQEH